VLVRSRIFWRLFAIQHAVLLPLMVAVAIAAGVLGNLSASQLLVVVGLIALAGSAAATVTAFTSARQLGSAVSDIGEVLRSAATGEHDVRVPIGRRWLLEPLGDVVNDLQERLSGRIADLGQNRDQLRTVLDSMVEAVMAIDSEQRTLLVNHSACRLFRFQEASAIGRPFYELVRSPQVIDFVTRGLASDDPVEGECELLGTITRPLAICVARLPSSGGVVVVISDLSELRRLESVRQEFVSNASHELKTPLASVTACAETLLDGADDDPEMRRHFLKTIQEQSDRMSRLVHDMLALTRVESQGLARVPRPIAFAAIAEICELRHRQNALRKGIALRVEPPAQAVWAMADDEPLEQIVDNLLDNAIKYTNSGGEVVLRWGMEGGSVLIEVEDTGIGIPQSQLMRIFERFYRVDKARSRDVGGTGLGLSIVKHMVQAIQGSVSVTSRIGKGSTFSIRLRPAEPGPSEIEDVA
jgi:two-component system phosphate regulon sensor histidine kinase PhoR